ncbi:acetate/propionate family kinase [Flavitalea flava]
MNGKSKNILTINGGSSSIKFALYSTHDEHSTHGEHSTNREEDNGPGQFQKKINGKIERIGLDDPLLTITDNSGKDNSGQNETTGPVPVKAATMEEAAQQMLDMLEKREDALPLSAIGHRVVHGMDHTGAAFIDEALLTELGRISDYDPDHLPGEIALIESCRKRYPGLPQVACFDTSFHAGLPRVARLLPLPRRFDDAGVRRYGFHGLSYSYLLEELGRIAGTQTANGRLILAHLGSGASITAVREGKSIDTSMGFTPAGGLVMGTRPGDLDPGALWYLLQKEKLNGPQFNDLINHQSGLLGISETSPDMRDLLEKEGTDVRAAEAVALFCYQVKKWIGSYSAVLGGLDTLVFTGGIGERSPVIRARICEGMEYLGVELADIPNKKNEVLISSGISSGTSSGQTKVSIYVIPTDEERMIAKLVDKLLDGQL